MEEKINPIIFLGDSITSLTHIIELASYALDQANQSNYVLVGVYSRKTNFTLGPRPDARQEYGYCFLRFFCEDVMVPLGHHLCVKPYFILEISHLWGFFVCFWDYNIDKIHGSDQCANIGTVIILVTPNIIGNLFQTLSDLGCILWVSSVGGTNLHSLDIGLEFMLNILAVICAVVIVLISSPLSAIKYQLIVLIDNIFKFWFITFSVTKYNIKV